MFNVGKFNLGKFNLPSKTSLSGTSNISFRNQATSTLIKYDLSKENIKYDNKSDYSQIISETSDTLIKFDSKAKGIRTIISTETSSLIRFKSQAKSTQTKIDEMSLSDLVLNPGDKLIINMCDLTVTVNGESVIRFVDDESRFFDLLNGENIIEYQDKESSRDLDFNIIYKDRWL